MCQHPHESIHYVSGASVFILLSKHARNKKNKYFNVYIRVLNQIRVKLTPKVQLMLSELKCTSAVVLSMIWSMADV